MWDLISCCTDGLSSNMAKVVPVKWWKSMRWWGESHGIQAEVNAAPSANDVVDSSLCSTDGTAGTLLGRFSSLMDDRRGIEVEVVAKSTWPYTKDLSAASSTSEPIPIWHVF